MPKDWHDWDVSNPPILMETAGRQTAHGGRRGDHLYGERCEKVAVATCFTHFAWPTRIVGAKIVLDLSPATAAQ